MALRERDIYSAPYITPVDVESFRTAKCNKIYCISVGHQMIREERSDKFSKFKSIESSQIERAHSKDKNN